MLLPWANASASEAAPAAASTSANAALVGALGRPAPARTPFAEARFMRMLDRPRVVSGELAWLGGDQLQRRVDHPQRETATIAHGEVTLQRAGKSPRHFSLSHAPQLQVLLDSFVALLGGDAARLQQAFAITRDGDPHGAWTLTLVPHDPRLAKSVGSITIDGHGGDSRCMLMQEPDGDLAIDLLGPLAARLPATPPRADLPALCRSAL